MDIFGLLDISRFHDDGDRGFRRPSEPVLNSHIHPIVDLHYGSRISKKEKNAEIRKIIKKGGISPMYGIPPHFSSL